MWILGLQQFNNDLCITGLNVSLGIAVGSHKLQFNITPFFFTCCQYSDYGVDWEGPTPQEDNVNTVDVPNTEEFLSQEDQQQLRDLLQEESEGREFDEDRLLIQHFLLVKQFIQGLNSST